jgi:flagellar operon protein
MKLQTNGYLSMEQLTDRYLNNTRKAEDTKGSDGTSFQQILEQKTRTESAGSLKFSKHALVRLNDRNIELDDGQLERLNQGAVKAGQKGIKDSLVIVDQLAFIVNVPNQTVVTAMDSTETDENVFTNINGAVIM